MIWATRLLRLCFVIVFGTMSLMHGPVMAYGAHHAPTMHHHSHHDGHGEHRHPAPRPDIVMCNSFACFLAVEPPAPSACPLHAILLGVMSSAVASEIHAAFRRPDIPPPRFQG